MAERISVKRTAELTGLSPLTIRHGLINNTLPIGHAIRNGTSRTTYHISPFLLANYLGLAIDKVKKG